MTTRQWFPFLILLGLGLRAFHYLRDPSVWHDEAALLVNVLEYDFLEMFGPLRWDEAAPPLFLWLQRATYLLLGDGTLAQRFPAFLASCLALLLFGYLARRLLPVGAALVAVLLFATSDRLLWHACEAKPYAFDVLLAAALLAYHVACSHWPLAVRLAGYLAVSPLVIWLAYPGAFLCGAALTALLPAVWRDRRPAILALYSLWAAAVAAAFLLLVLGPVQAQRTGPMDACWTNHFPDWSRPWRVPFWAVASTWEVVRYCVKPLGQVLLLPAVVGGCHLWQESRRGLVLLAVGPLGLALIAALLHRYPYGGSRLEVFAAPGLILLVAAGLNPVLAWLRNLHQFAPAAILLVVAAVPSTTAFRLVRPWPRADCSGAAAYVLDHRTPGEAVAANHWEYVYYFRNLDGPFALLTDSPPPASAATLWLALTAPRAKERQALAAKFLADWHIRDQRDFAMTTVLRLERIAR